MKKKKYTEHRRRRFLPSKELYKFVIEPFLSDIFWLIVMCLLGSWEIQLFHTLENSTLAYTVFYIIEVVIFIVNIAIVFRYAFLLKTTLKIGFHGLLDYTIFLHVVFQVVYTFTIVYFTIYVIDDQSFAGVSLEKGNVFFSFFYFSVVTFTTLGYGDIYPVSILARSVVILEVLFFAVYISIILISMRNKNDKNVQTKDFSDEQVTHQAEINKSIDAELLENKTKKGR